VTSWGCIICSHKGFPEGKRFASVVDAAFPFRFPSGERLAALERGWSTVLVGPQAACGRFPLPQRGVGRPKLSLGGRAVGVCREREV